MKAMIAMLMVLGALGLAGCNTMQGLGEDLEAAGEGISNKAEEKKGY